MQGGGTGEGGFGGEAWNDEARGGRVWREMGWYYDGGGTCVVVHAGASDYAEVKERYLARFPQSAMMFGFADFALWELRLQDAHLILGFGQAYLADATTPLTWTHQKPEQKGS